MLQIIDIKKMDVKLIQLRQVYEWFIAKLISIGALTRQEIEDENKFLNPLTNQMAEAMKTALGKKTKQLCADEEYMAHANKQMYLPNRFGAPPQRTWHADIDPSAVRILNYKTKLCRDGIADQVKEIKEAE